MNTENRPDNQTNTTVNPPAPEIKNPDGLVKKNRELLDEVRELRTRLQEMEAMHEQTKVELAATQASAIRVKQEKAEWTLDQMFKNSEYVKKRLAIPRQASEIIFASYFTIEDGRILVDRQLVESQLEKMQGLQEDQSGRVILNQQAHFDAVMECFVHSLDWKDGILRGTGSSGGGATGGGDSLPIPETPEDPQRPKKPTGFGLR